MEVLFARCSGLDVHKRSVVACARIQQVLHSGTTDNLCDRERPLLGREKRVSGDESACYMIRFKPNRPNGETLESGKALGSGLAKGNQSIQGEPGRVAF